MGWKLSHKTPFDTQHDEAYASIVFFAMDRAAKQMRVGFNVYASEAAAAKGAQPLQQVEILAGPAPRVIQAEVTEPVTGDVLLPLITVPSFDQLMAANKDVFDAAAGAIYDLSATLPAFAKAEKV